METLKVVAQKGTRCPRRNPRSMPITDSEPATVPATPFYLRLIADGSLIKISNSAAAADQDESKKRKSKKQPEDKS